MRAKTASDTLHRPDLLAGEDLLPEPGQHRSRERRKRLLDAALRLFALRGYDETTIAEIAKKAGAPVGSFYQHFRSKRQLLLVLMDEFLRKLEAVPLNAAGAHSLREAIREILEAGFKTDLEYIAAYRAWRQAIAVDRDLAEKNMDIEAWTTQRVTQAFLALKDSPHVRAQVRRDVFARLLDHLFWDVLNRPLEDSDDVLDTLTDIMVHTLFRDEGVQ